MADQKILFEIYLENNEFKVKANEAMGQMGKIGDAAGNAGKKADSASGLFGNLTSGWMKQIIAGGTLIYTFNKVVGVLKSVVKATSDLEETTNKYNVTFSEVRKEADAVAKSLQDMYGMSQQESKKYLSDVGDLLSGLGMTQTKSLQLAESVTKLGTDLASFTNIEGGAERAIHALTAGMLGEREALKSLGIIITEEMVTDRLRAENKQNLKGLALQQAKAEIAMAMAMEQSNNAIGDMARSYDSFANVTRRVHSRSEDLKSELGKGLMPALGNLGLAFLEATKSGGVLMNFFEGVIDMIADVINGWSILILTLNQKSLEKQNQANLAYSKEQMRVYKESNAVIKQTWGTYENLVAVSKQNTEEGRKAAQYLMLYNAQKQKALAANQLTQKGFEQEQEANKAIIKIKERIANKDKEIADNYQKASKAKQTTMAKEASEEQKRLQLMFEAQAKYYEATGQLTEAALAKNSANRAKDTAELDQMLQKGKMSHADYEEAKANLTAYYVQQELVIKETSWQQEQKAKQQSMRIQYGFESKAFQGTQMIAQAGMQLMNEKNKVLFNIGKVAAITNIIMSAAEAILKGMSYGPWIGIPYAALVGTVSGLQLSRVAAQKPPQDAKIKASGPPSISFDVGTWSVPADMPAMVHRNEMIIPATFAQSVRSGEAVIGSGGGSGGNIYITVQGSVIDTQGLLSIVDDAQADMASRMGAKRYSFKSAY